MNNEDKLKYTEIVKNCVYGELIIYLIRKKQKCSLLIVIHSKSIKVQQRKRDYLLIMEHEMSNLFVLAKTEYEITEYEVAGFVTYRKANNRRNEGKRVQNKGNG